jgi:maltose O-acetyltransferase
LLDSDENCFLEGVTIGDISIIATGTVVARDIPSNCLAGGVPAEVKKYYGESEK